MERIVVLVEHGDGGLTKTTTELVTAANLLGEVVAVVVGVPGTTDALTDKLGLLGVRTVYAAEVEGITSVLATPKVDALEYAVNALEAAAVVVAASAEDREVAGRLAVRLDSGLLTDVTEIAPNGTAQQGIFAGSISVTSRVKKGTPIFAVKPGAIEPASTSTVQADVPARENIPTEVPVGGARIVRSEVEATGSRPELTEASVVVSGGRGVGSAENFALVEQLADAFGGAVGASRAATDADYYPHQFQVGQTGKSVTPQLYIAVGISGAIQHISGMQASHVIVAINSDAEAPIFTIADFGIVGDLFQVVPQIMEALDKRRA